MTNPSDKASKRGRKRKIHTAYSDFTLADARKDYEERREQFAAEAKSARRAARSRGDKLPRGLKEPWRRAAEETISERANELKNISARRLLNAFDESARIEMSDADYPENGEIDQLS